MGYAVLVAQFRRGHVILLKQLLHAGNKGSGAGTNPGERGWVPAGKGFLPVQQDRLFSRRQVGCFDTGAKGVPRGCSPKPLVGRLASLAVIAATAGGNQVMPNVGSALAPWVNMILLESLLPDTFSAIEALPSRLIKQSLTKRPFLPPGLASGFCLLGVGFWNFQIDIRHRSVTPRGLASAVAMKKAVVPGDSEYEGHAALAWGWARCAFGAFPTQCLRLSWSALLPPFLNAPDIDSLVPAVDHI